MENPKTKTPAGARFFLFAKVCLIGFLVLVLLIPTLMIRGLIHEREGRQAEARQEVAQGWGGWQQLSGPILIIPYQYDVVEKQSQGPDKIVTKTDYAYFLPENLQIEGGYQSKVLHRGIFNVPVYTGRLQISGIFKRPDFRKLEIPEGRVLWHEAYLSVGLTDLKGVRNNVLLQWNGREYSMGPEHKKGNLYAAAIQSHLPDVETWPAPETRSFKMGLELAGSQSAQFLPLGKETQVSLQSDWPHPSFTGHTLPTQRKITPEGFQASWKIPQTGRNLPQQWKGTEITERYLAGTAFGPDFILPIDTYQFSERSVKYASLFILLTFVAFFLFEILGRLRIHPVQYLLVGVAMVLFYLLLLSLSEHLSFGLAYAVAAFGTIALITVYISQVLRKRRWALLMAGVFSALYAYLYTLLRAEDFALLMGSLGLFFILAVIMFLTRKINWYEIGGPRAAATLEASPSA